MNRRAQELLEKLPAIREAFAATRNGGMPVPSYLFPMLDRMEDALRRGNTAEAMREMLPLVREIAEKKSHPVIYLFAYRLCIADAGLRDAIGC